MNPLKALAMFAIVAGLVLITSCGEDDPDCEEKTWYADTDGDGLGDPAVSQSACEQPTGYVDNDDDDDDTQGEPTKTIWELVESTEGLDSLEKYLGVYPDLVATLDANGTFTFFAPDNEAFINLLATPGFPAQISSINPDIIKNVLAYHISASQYLKADLSAGTQVTTLATGQGSDVNGVDKVVVNADGTLLTGSSNPNIEISGADKKATNGVMHVVASVLIPQTVGAQLTPILGTNAGALLLGADFSILAQAIFKADTFAATNSLTTLVSIFAGDDTHTVFAPTNATFNAASLTAASFTGQQWYGIISNHIVLDEVLDTELTTGATFSTAYTTDGVNFGQLLVFNDVSSIPAQNGVGIYLDGNGDVDLTDQTTLANLDAEVALPNAVVNPNGRVHVIAGVLSPQ